MSKVVILAGGKGLRFGEETKKKPKPDNSAFGTRQLFFFFY